MSEQDLEQQREDDKNREATRQAGEGGNPSTPPRPEPGTEPPNPTPPGEQAPTSEPPAEAPPAA